MRQISTTVVGGTVAVVIAAISVYMLRKTRRQMELKLQELEEALAASVEICAAERQGRIRAQQAMRKALLQPKSDNLNGKASYPMTSIGTVESCFTTRNGTPRQPLLVPLARACLVFDPKRVPLGSLEGLEQYSHCWIIFVFHLNTDLDKLWKDPSQSNLKAKVRVPRLEGGRMGVFATRSPHRPLPIGLSVAKVEAVQGHTVLLSGVDLVDGTPVLDIKPYLPYCDSIQEATVPDWILADNLLAVSSIKFSDKISSELSYCWESLGNYTLYESPDEIQRLIQQVLSWDIRSSSQRARPRKSSLMVENNQVVDASWDHAKQKGEDQVLDQGSENEKADISNTEVIYHLALEGLDVSYKIDCEGNVTVEGVQLNPTIYKVNKRWRSYSVGRKEVV